MLGIHIYQTTDNSPIRNKLLVMEWWCEKFHANLTNLDQIRQRRHRAAVSEILHWIRSVSAQKPESQRRKNFIRLGEIQVKNISDDGEAS